MFNFQCFKLPQFADGLDRGPEEVRSPRIPTSLPCWQRTGSTIGQTYQVGRGRVLVYSLFSYGLEKRIAFTLDSLAYKTESSFTCVKVENSIFAEQISVC